MTDKAPPCVLVIFGAAGDLTKRLLMPALYNLVHEKLLDDRFAIIGYSHGESDDEAFRKKLLDGVKEIMSQSGGEAGARQIDDGIFAWLRERLFYVRGDFDTAKDFDSLKQRFASLCKERGHDNAIFYLATAPDFFGPIADNLGQAGLLKESGERFRRVVIEKPFGRDLATAKELNAKILGVAAETQVFRIDHFLGKETVQNIMVLRFANFMFEPIWNRDHIDHIEITAAETVNVETRGKLYDSIGALRDMVPNHMFQLLAMMAMEAPNSFDADAIRSEKAKAIEAIRKMSPEDAVADAVRGQYGAGNVKGKAVPAYREAQNIDAKTQTETYVALKFWIDNWRWQDVPFYIRTGKALAARRTEIVVHFKKAPGILFRDLDNCDPPPCRMIFGIQPDEGVSLRIVAKKPGRKVHLSDVTMNFRYADYFQAEPSTGYETLIYDCMIGDATLFQRADNVEAGWAAVQPILDAWAKGLGKVNLYEAGTAGPKAADELLKHDGREWRALS